MTALAMYLIDTDIISELSKAQTANRGVVEFMSKISAKSRALLSILSAGFHINRLQSSYSAYR